MTRETPPLRPAPEGQFGGLRMRELGADEEAIAFGWRLLSKIIACGTWRATGRISTLQSEEALGIVVSGER